MCAPVRPSILLPNDKLKRHGHETDQLARLSLGTHEAWTSTTWTQALSLTADFTDNL